MIRNDNKTKEEHLLWIICSWLLPPPEAGVKCTFMSFAEARYSFMFVIVHCLYVCLFAYIFVFVYLHCTHTLSCVWVCKCWCAIVEFVQLHICVCDCGQLSSLHTISHLGYGFSLSREVPVLPRNVPYPIFNGTFCLRPNLLNPLDLQLIMVNQPVLVIRSLWNLNRRAHQATIWLT